MCGGREAERGPQGGRPTAGSAPYPGVRARGRGVGPPCLRLGSGQGCGGCLLHSGAPGPALLSEPPNPRGPEGHKGRLNPSHGPGLPAAPKATQSSVLRFQSSTAHLSITGRPGQLALEAHPILTGISPNLCLLVTPPPELPLTLRPPRTTRLGEDPTDDSGESPELSSLVNHIFKAPLAEEVAYFHFRWYSRCWRGVGGGEGPCAANTGNLSTHLPG